MCFYLRKIIKFNQDWQFRHFDSDNCITVNLPHTWNGTDGQDGGNDYARGKCVYSKTFDFSDLPDGEEHYIEFKGCNSSATVFLNGEHLATHHGGYSTFRAKLDVSLKKGENVIEVEVDNSENDSVYPQFADFTFYGGIYRDINIIGLSKNHFDLDYFGSDGVKIDTAVLDGKGIVNCSSFIKGEGKVILTVFDAKGNKVCSSENSRAEIENVELWDGIKSPYLYTARLSLMLNGEECDCVEKRIGFRTFFVDSDKGFFLNGRSYPLRGVCRHQDRPEIGNALTEEHHNEDIDLILEVGANTVRLAHYQHDDAFYDLCDEKGLVVWAEIPYISKHLKNGDKNALLQMKELIVQLYHHPSIVCWGISNEITMKPAGKGRYLLHKELNELCKSLDPERYTVLACYMISNFRNKLNAIPDMISYNMYFGWYLPFTCLAGNKLDRYHKKYKDRIIGLSEYGADCMPSLHSVRPLRGDNTEEYQCVYHEKMLRIINDRPYIWASHLWNMFDFAADAREQGGDPGKNHKGLVTFDRKTKKDAFYLYKAFWSDEPFVHINGKRFENRTGKNLKIKVYSNRSKVSLYNNGNLIETKKGDKIFSFDFVAEKINNLKVVTEDGLSDTATINIVPKKDRSYIMQKSSNKSWEKSRK